MEGASKDSATYRDRVIWEIGHQNVVRHEIVEGLPPLTGTDKQVAWAKDIRAKYIDWLVDLFWPPHPLGWRYGRVRA
jgi:hypothetical protein